MNCIEIKFINDLIYQIITQSFSKVYKSRNHFNLNNTKPNLLDILKKNIKIVLWNSQNITNL